jgi:hypothetical protein
MPNLDYGSSRVPDKTPTEAFSSTRRDSSRVPTDRVSITLKSSYDEKMAARQTKITSLAPREREEQEAWAQQQLQHNAGACIAGYTWMRADNCGELNGYRCHGGNHFVTDELLAEGRARCYLKAQSDGQPRWEGPYTEQEIHLAHQRIVHNMLNAALRPQHPPGGPDGYPQLPGPPGGRPPFRPFPGRRW